MFQRKYQQEKHNTSQNKCFHWKVENLNLHFHTSFIKLHPGKAEKSAFKVSIQSWSSPKFPDIGRYSGEHREMFRRSGIDREYLPHEPMLLFPIYSRLSPEYRTPDHPDQWDRAVRLYDNTNKLRLIDKVCGKRLCFSVFISTSVIEINIQSWSMQTGKPGCFRSRFVGPILSSIQ